jgi:hypothetical protein
MSHEEYKLTAADPRDLAEAVALALRFFEGRTRNRDANVFRATIAAERVVRHLEGAGFVVMKKPPVGDIRRRDGILRVQRAQQFADTGPSVMSHVQLERASISQSAGRG